MKRVFFTLVSFVLPAIVLAQGSNPVRLNNPLRSGNTLTGFVASILNDVVVPVGAVVVVIAVIYSGFLFVIAQGNEQKLEKAKMTFLFTVIGAAVLLGAAVIANIITVTINQLR